MASEPVIADPPAGKWLIRGARGVCPGVGASLGSVLVDRGGNAWGFIASDERTAADRWECGAREGCRSRFQMLVLEPVGVCEIRCGRGSVR